MKRSRPSDRTGLLRAALLAAIVSAVLGVSTVPVAAQASSAHYRLRPATLDSAGASSTSAGWRVSAALGQEVVVGASAAPHFIVQSGVFAFLGSPLVPVELTVTRSPSQSPYVNLSWTGNDPRYNLYRNTVCASVFSSVLATTTSNAYNDATSSTTGLTCYNVIADGPGPVPPSHAAP